MINDKQKSHHIHFHFQVLHMFIFIICSHSNEKVTAQTFFSYRRNFHFFFFLIEGIFIVFAILLFLYLFFSKLPPFPLQNSRGEEQVLPPSPKGFQQHHPSPSEPFPLLCYLLLGATSTFFSIKKKDEQPR